MAARLEAGIRHSFLVSLARLFTHSVLVYPYTLTASSSSSSMAWPPVPASYQSDCLITESVYPYTLALDWW
jgi:hypothetical protein